MSKTGVTKRTKYDVASTLWDMALWAGRFTNEDPARDLAIYAVREGLSLAAGVADGNYDDSRFDEDALRQRVVDAIREAYDRYAEATGEVG